jgi:hypothetical protein
MRLFSRADFEGRDQCPFESADSEIAVIPNEGEA